MKKANRELVQYYVVNDEMAMTAEKMAVQVAHAATTMTLHYLFNDNRYHDAFQEWLQSGQKKTVLRGSPELLAKLAKSGYLLIRDSMQGDTPGGLPSVVVMPPMDREAGQQIACGAAAGTGSA